MASNYGKTWWGQQWLNSLNNIDYSNRLPRGASYARKGAVKKINISGNRPCLSYWTEKQCDGTPFYYQEYFRGAHQRDDSKEKGPC